jgi:PGF-CTERM protein
MKKSDLIILTLAVFLSPEAMAANPMDLMAAPLQDSLNLNATDLGKKALDHIAQGNLTQEHISQDINATKEQVKKEAVSQINQNLNITPEQIQQRAKEELQNQVSQKVQQPGFEALLALAGILGIAYVFSRRN